MRRSSSTYVITRRPRVPRQRNPRERRINPTPQSTKSQVTDSYRELVADSDEGLSTWAQYIRAATTRGTDTYRMSVAELARRSGIHPSTIFLWRKQQAGDGRGVNVESVRAVANALDDDPENALRAAGNVVVPGDPRQTPPIASNIGSNIGWTRAQTVTETYTVADADLLDLIDKIAGMTHIPAAERLQRIQQVMELHEQAVTERQRGRREDPPVAGQRPA